MLIIIITYFAAYFNYYCTRLPWSASPQQTFTDR